MNQKIPIIAFLIICISCVNTKVKRLSFVQEETPTITGSETVTSSNYKKATLSISRVVNGGDKWYIYLHLIGANGKHLDGLTDDILDISYSRIARKLPMDTHEVKRLKIENIADEGCNPMSLMFSIDRSGSMIHNAEKTRSAAKKFVESKFYEDEIGIVVFGSWAKREAELSTNKKRLIDILDNVDLTKFSGTNFTYGIDKALNSVKYQAHHEDKGILLLSDGYGMSAGQANRLINKARNLGIAIHFYQYKPFDEKTRKEHKIKDDGKLARRMASATGGIYKCLGVDNDFAKEFMDLRYKACHVYKVTIDKPDASGEYLYTFKFKHDYVQKRLDFGIKYTYSDLTFFHQKNMGNTKLEKPAVLDRIDSLFADNPTEVSEDPEIDEIYLLNVYFDFDQAILKDGSEKAVQEVYDLLNENSRMRIELRGHTDNKGSAEYNKKLSLERCLSVKEALVRKGIDGSRIEVIGFGASIPVATNNTDEGRSKNRRTEFRILEK